MKKVCVIFNGGTISMKIDPNVNAAVPTLSGKEILGMVSGIENYAAVETYNFSSLPSPHMTPELMLELSNKVKEELKKDDIVGVVVTHGTDSLEETAYFLDLTINSEKPVVFTGSMKNSSEAGYDGPSNLQNAISIAISDEARNKGVLVCLDNDIHAASEVTKSHTTHLHTFKTVDFGALGIVSENKPVFYREKTRKQYIETNNIETKVDLIKAVTGMDGKLIDFCVEQGDKGLVIEGMGSGNIPPKMAESVKKAIDKGVAVVLVSRCFEGRVTEAYGYPGGGKMLRNMGVIFGDNLPGQKARIKLIVALGKTNNVNEIRDLFEKGLY